MPFDIVGLLAAITTMITAAGAVTYNKRRSKRDDDTSWQGMVHKELERALARIDKLEERDQIKERRIELLERFIRSHDLEVPGY